MLSHCFIDCMFSTFLRETCRIYVRSQSQHTPMEGTWGVAPNGSVIWFKATAAAAGSTILQQLAQETDTILFDLRAAHDSVLALAVNQQVVQDVRAKLFDQLGGQLADVLTAAGFVVLRKTKTSRDADCVTLKRVHDEMDGSNPPLEQYLVPALNEGDLASTVYPAESQETVDDLIRAVPSRARGYQLAGSVRTYLSGFRDDPGAAPAPGGAALPARPWDSDGSDLLSTEAILDEAEAIASVAIAALRKVASADVWLVSTLDFRGLKVAPFVSGPVAASHKFSVPPPYKNAPSLQLAYDHGMGIFSFVSVGGDAPPTAVYTSQAGEKWQSFQRVSATESILLTDVVFEAFAISKTHLHSAPGGYTTATLLGVDSHSHQMRWQTPHGNVLCGTMDTKLPVCWATQTQNGACCNEAAVPAVAREAGSGVDEAGRQLRELMTSWPVPAKDHDFRNVIKAKLENTYELHAYHGTSHSVASGRNDVPVVRIGGAQHWFTGQHTLSSTTGMMLAYRIAEIGSVPAVSAS